MGGGETLGEATFVWLFLACAAENLDVYLVPDHLFGPRKPEAAQRLLQGGVTELSNKPAPYAHRMVMVRRASESVAGRTFGLDLAEQLLLYQHVYGPVDRRSAHAGETITYGVGAETMGRIRNGGHDFTTCTREAEPALFNFAYNDVSGGSHLVPCLVDT